MASIYQLCSPCALKIGNPTPFHIQAELTTKTNFLGTQDVCTQLLPLIKPRGKSDWSPSCSASQPCLPLVSSTGPATSPAQLHWPQSVSLPGQVPCSLSSEANRYSEDGSVLLGLKIRSYQCKSVQCLLFQSPDVTWTRRSTAGKLVISSGNLWSSIPENWVSILLVLTFLGNGLCCALGRVLNVSSRWGFKALENCSPELQQKFRSKTITEEELVGLMNKFVEDTKKGVHRKEGWPETAYGVTKIGITVLSRIQARKLSEQRGGDKILLNACCPGWVRTDMAGPRATKSPEEGAETPVYLALLPSDAEGPHGEFACEKKS
ncbi:hypothetical protein J1605_019922 [Eschrichtius robustus]|uniref:Carbonyl reductase [NADPH] 1 n=1 Tax=Eschrichtius robustus TaxID=9764 RepID=A0AB34HMY7_ESCRO|nr:hypothetical protein J1605_019922 [Eschrichtius robustus]